MTTSAESTSVNGDLTQMVPGDTTVGTTPETHESEPTEGSLGAASARLVFDPIDCDQITR